VSPDGTKVYATISQPEGAGFDLLYTIDAASGAQQQHALDFHPGDLVAGKDGRLWIVGCRGLCSDGALHGVDPANPGRAVQLILPTVPGQIAIAADGARAYVANGHRHVGLGCRSARRHHRQDTSASARSRSASRPVPTARSST